MKDAITILGSLLLFCSIQAQKNDWENQNVTQINKEKPAATLFYDDGSEVLLPSTAFGTLYITMMLCTPHYQ